MQIKRSDPVHDVVVIGSGAAGGMTAWNLTRKGINVVVLDAGTKFDKASFWSHVKPWEWRDRIESGKQPPQFYLDTKEQPYVTDPKDPFELVRVWGRGGKTNVWGRVSLRYSDVDFAGPERDGWEIPWPIRYKDVAPYYDRVDQLIGVCGGDDDQDSLPGSKFHLPAPAPRCGERLMQKAAKQVGVSIVAGRRAVLTRAHNGRAKCHFCGACGKGCDVSAFFNASDYLLEPAFKTGKLTLVDNAVVARVLVDDKGLANGVQYFNRKSGEEHKVLAKRVVVAASCVDSTRILLNSKSTAYPNGIGNSSDVVGRYLCEQIRLNHVGWMPSLAGGPTRNDRGIGGEHIYLRRFNHKPPHKRDYLRGFGVQFWNTGCSDTGAHAGSETIPGFGAALKKEIKRRHPAWVEIHPFGEALPYANNRITVGGAGEDRYGVPLMTIDYQVGENERKMTEHMADT